MKEFSLVKRVAKHGKQSIIVIPKLLEDHLKPGTVVKLSLEIIKEAENEK